MGIMKLEPLTKSQMANILGISLRTFQRKLHRAGLNIPRGLLSPDCQNHILVILGYSGMVSGIKNNGRRSKNKSMIINSYTRTKKINERDLSTSISTF